MSLADLSKIQQKVIEDAMRKLLAANCKFAILLPDGEKLGDLELALPKKHGKGSRINNFIRTGYRERVRAMKVGDVEVFETDGTSIKNYQSAICSCGLRAFGNGHFNTCINGSTIEAMRTD